MAERKPNDVKIVAWLLVAKKLIKFANDETSYKISDNVMTKSNFDKFPLNKGDRVEVGLQEGVVTFLRKQKSESKGQGSEEAYEPTPEEAVDTRLDKPTPAPKVAEPEVKKEEPIKSLGTEDITTLRELTVFAVAANKKVIKFAELKDAGWFQIDTAIQAQDYAVIGLQAKNKVKVTFNDKTVISVAKVASEPAETPKTATSSPETAKVEPTAAPAAQTSVQAPKKEWKPYPSQESDSRQKSIEAQAAVNAASNVAAKVAAAITTASKKEDGSTNAPTANVINNIIRAIAESNFALIQELKNK